jgi:ferrochelatase
MIPNNIGVLLTNIGTPDEPTPTAVRRYLKEFLTDRRIIEIPRLIWIPILYGLILPTRAKKSAKLYQKIWTAKGSPLLCHSEQLKQTLAQQLNIPIALGMHYGKPSIATALEELKKKNVEKILILPLYPQYSATTTASTFDALARTLKNWRVIPEIRTINDYADHPLYIKALAHSIRTAEIQHKSQRLLFSFHGIPKQFIAAGDSYQKRCEITIALLVKELGLNANDYLLSFQSRLGKAKWLQPYTDHLLKTLPKQGIHDIQVICPGFAVDCLETLEEIAITGKQQFLKNGGQLFHYVPALNNSPEHIQLLSELIKKNIANW